MQREGKDVTLVGFGRCVGHNLKAAEELEKAGISAEVCTSRCVALVIRAHTCPFIIWRLCIAFTAVMLMCMMSCTGLGNDSSGRAFHVGFC